MMEARVVRAKLGNTSTYHAEKQTIAECLHGIFKCLEATTCALNLALHNYFIVFCVLS